MHIAQRPPFFSAVRIEIGLLHFEQDVRVSVMRQFSGVTVALTWVA
jgi:hypothetical protein